MSKRIFCNVCNVELKSSLKHHKTSARHRRKVGHHYEILWESQSKKKKIVEEMEIRGDEEGRREEEGGEMEICSNGEREEEGGEMETHGKPCEGDEESTEREIDHHNGPNHGKEEEDEKDLFEGVEEEMEMKQARNYENLDKTEQKIDAVFEFWAVKRCSYSELQTLYEFQCCDCWGGYFKFNPRTIIDIGNQLQMKKNPVSMFPISFSHIIFLALYYTYSSPILD